MATKTSTYSKEGMRARLRELQGQQAAIEAVSGPMRVERDAYVASLGDKEREMGRAIVEAEAGLYDIKQEVVLLTRALGTVDVSDSATTEAGSLE